LHKACEKGGKKGKEGRRSKRIFPKIAFFAFYTTKRAKMKKFFRILNTIAPVSVHTKRKRLLE